MFSISINSTNGEVWRTQKKVFQNPSQNEMVFKKKRN